MHPEIAGLDHCHHEIGKLANDHPDRHVLHGSLIQVRHVDRRLVTVR